MFRKKYMGRNKVILVDADVISHFMATGYIDKLTEILQPHAVMIVENVYKEAGYHPTQPDRKRKIDEWMARCRVCKISFPYANENIRREFFRLKKESPMLGEGERACMSMARFGQEAIASSNFRDVAPYCIENGIEYIGTLDILTIAMNKGIVTSKECNQFIMDAKAKNKARFPVEDITDYEAPEFIRTF
mgnify:FL=1